MKYLGHETRGLARAGQALSLALDALQDAQRELTLATPLEPEYSQDFKSTFGLMTQAHASANEALQQIERREMGPSGELMMILGRNAGLAGLLEMVATKLGIDAHAGIPDTGDEFREFSDKLFTRLEAKLNGDEYE